MFARRFAALALVLVVAAASRVYAAQIWLTVETDQTTYLEGQTVNWTIKVETDNSTSDNWGISALGVNLAEDQAETLSAASGFGPAFPYPAVYNFQHFGVAADSEVLGIAVAQFLNAGNAAQIGGGGPDVFAYGSYTATVLGTHTLTASIPNPVDRQYWNTQSASTSSAFSMAGPAFANFNVNAIPEPSTVVMLLGLAAGVGALCWRRRSV